MTQLMLSHRQALAEQFTGIYGLTLSLILIHALHVVGGLVPMGLLGYKAYQDRLGPEHGWLVHSCAKYWHFLEAVWIVMFGSLLIVR